MPIGSILHWIILARVSKSQGRARMRGPNRAAPIIRLVRVVPVGRLEMLACAPRSLQCVRTLLPEGASRLRRARRPALEEANEWDLPGPVEIRDPMACKCSATRVLARRILVECLYPTAMFSKSSARRRGMTPAARRRSRSGRSSKPRNMLLNGASLRDAT